MDNQTQLKKTDLREGMTVMINPTLSEKGKYRDYLGELAEVTNIERYSWGEDTVTITMKRDGVKFSNVGNGTLLATDDTKQDLQDILISSLKKQIGIYEEKIQEAEAEIQGIELKIEFVKETDRYSFDNKDFKRWQIKRIVSNENIDGEEKERLIEDLL